MGPRMKPPSRARANGALGAAPETVCPAAGLGRTHRAVSGATAADRDEHRVRRLIARLPRRLRHRVRWLRRPASRWVRIPAAILLIAGAGLSILPFFGLDAALGSVAAGRGCAAAAAAAQSCARMDRAAAPALVWRPSERDESACRQ